MKTKGSFARRWIGGGLGLVSLTLLAGCVNSPPWGGWSETPSAEQIAAGRGRLLPPLATPPQVYAAVPGR